MITPANFQQIMGEMGQVLENNFGNRLTPELSMGILQRLSARLFPLTEKPEPQKGEQQNG